MNLNIPITDLNYILYLRAYVTHQCKTQLSGYYFSDERLVCLYRTTVWVMASVVLFYIRVYKSVQVQLCFIVTLTDKNFYVLSLISPFPFKLNWTSYVMKHSFTNIFKRFFSDCPDEDFLTARAQDFLIENNNFIFFLSSQWNN